MWFFNSDKNNEKKARQNALLQAAVESSTALEQAAKGTMNLAEDVTKALQDKIEEYAQQIEQTARLLSDALIEVDDHGIIETLNPAAEQMFGYKKREIRGKCFSMLFDFEKGLLVDAKFMDDLNVEANMVNPEAIVHYERFKGLRSNGLKFFVNIGVSRLQNANKSLSYLILVRDVTQQVSNQQTLKELADRNQELLTTIDSSSTGFIILGLNGAEYDITFVNEGFSEVSGLSKEVVLSGGLKGILGVESEFWTIRRALVDGVECRHELQLIFPNCKKLWFDVQLTPVTNGETIDRWILVFYDITSLKKAYDDLRASESHFKAFGDASSEGMMIHDFNRIMEWNNQLNTLTGYSDSELEIMAPLDLVHPLERTNMMLPADSESEPAKNYETLWLTKSGDVREVAVNSTAIEWESVEARIAIVRDVTQYRDVETQLKSARERYRTVVDNTIDLLVCFNSDMIITFSNQTFRDYFDVEVDDINGLCILEIIPESDHEKFKSYMLSIKPDSEVRRAIHRIKRHEEIRMQDWIDRGIFDKDGNLVEIQSVARDVTSLLSPPQ